MNGNSNGDTRHGLPNFKNILNVHINILKSLDNHQNAGLISVGEGFHIKGRDMLLILMSKESEILLNLKFKIKYFVKDKKDKSNYDLSQKRVEQVAMRLLKNWLSTKNLVEKYGVGFIAILQPNVAVVKPVLVH